MANCTTEGNSPNSRLDSLETKWNEAEISKSSLNRWIQLIPQEEHDIAMRLLECIEMHGWSRLLRECRVLHKRLQEDLGAEGYDIETYSNIDFTRAFTCKSGDLISYAYRKANKIPVANFHNIEALHNGTPTKKQAKALVILDDYIGTASQFLFTWIARKSANQDLLRQYRRIRLAAIVAHDNAREKWRLLQKRQFNRVMEIEEKQLTCVNFAPEREELIKGLSKVNWQHTGLISAQHDFPVTARDQLSTTEREELRNFIDRHANEDGAGTTEFLLGHHTFFYGAPNAMARVLLPLLKRIEDFTTYPLESQQGLASDLIEYDIDNQKTATQLYPRLPQGNS